MFRLLVAGAVAAALSGPATAPAAALPQPCLPVGLLPPTGDCTPAGDTLAPLRPPAPGPVGREGCPYAHLEPRGDNVRRLADATLCLLNVERARRKLRPLERNRTLDRVAGSYARQMVDARFFSHVSPRGTTLAQRLRSTSYLHGLRRWDIGENLAWGTGTLASPARTVRSWMGSPGHRRNILDRRYREIGIGAALGVPVRLRNAPAGATYAHVFGRRVRR